MDTFLEMELSKLFSTFSNKRHITKNFFSLEFVETMHYTYAMLGIFLQWLAILSNVIFQVTHHRWVAVHSSPLSTQIMEHWLWNKILKYQTYSCIPNKSNMHNACQYTEMSKCKQKKNWLVVHKFNWILQRLNNAKLQTVNLYKITFFFSKVKRENQNNYRCQNNEQCYLLSP